jgi:hypothetical protein
MNRKDFSKRTYATDYDSRTTTRRGNGFARMPSPTHAPRRRRDAMHRVSTPK